jgi:hypothetical protein
MAAPMAAAIGAPLLAPVAGPHAASTEYFLKVYQRTGVPAYPHRTRTPSPHFPLSITPVHFIYHLAVVVGLYSAADALRAVGMLRDNLGRRVNQCLVKRLEAFIDEDLGSVTAMRERFEREKAACDAARAHYLSCSRPAAMAQAAVGIAIWDMGYRFRIRFTDMDIHHIDMVILDVGMGYGLMIWEMIDVAVARHVIRFRLIQ